MRHLLCLLVLSVIASPLAALEPWATYRGNVERTGNTDGKPGPANPKVLWVMKSKDHFIATPAPLGNRLFVSGLGPFNVANFYNLDTDVKAGKRVAWTKTTPYLKLPTVSSPGLFKGRAVFGDGMHQTDGATLHCLNAVDGLPLWQLPVPGTLVHLEGSPTIAEGRVYIGAGAGGVLCVELEKLSFQGKEMKIAEVDKLVRATWKDLLEKYEIEKKKDPDFAVPPTEDQLPRAAPFRVWQEGSERWHVDAPVSVVGDRVLVGSAYLDKEKVGDRSLQALDAKTGKVLWRTPLALNPWGGPSVSGSTIVVAGSSIGYYPNLLKGAQGDVAAYDLADGKEKWRKPLKAGAVSCVALSEGLAIATATDGKVRAFDLASGEKRWIYEGKTPFFAAPAVVGGVVYAGDLQGVVHAIDAKSGQQRWTLDLGKSAEVQSPGMIYGGPVLHGGRIYVATCNLEGPAAGQPTAVVCIGE